MHNYVRFSCLVETEIFICWKRQVIFILNKVCIDLDFAGVAPGRCYPGQCNGSLSSTVATCSVLDVQRVCIFFLFL